jgi:NhaA family Na+:H+ antiporter
MTMSESAARKRLLFPDPATDESTFLGDLLRREAVGGSVALVAAAVAILWANSPWSASYDDLRHLQLGPLDLEHWAADGALALFFFVAGLELKRELVVGTLRRPIDAAVPVVAAICGVAVPATIYLVVNSVADGGRIEGWAIPAATDIAFALAVLAVVGSNLPTALRAFLLALAVVDDVLVVVIIAVFYTDELHVIWLAAAGAGCLVWALLQRARVHGWWIFLPLSVFVWWDVHESGVHATIAGMVLGLLTRVRPDAGESSSPAEALEHRLSPISSSLAVPLFALLSAGVALDAGADLVTNPVAIGVVLALVLGKPMGVFLGTYAVTRFTHATLGPSLTYRDIAGVSILAGIGFTVSLLVADLSFDGEVLTAAKTAVLGGSLVSAVIGALVLGHRDRFHSTP